MSGMTLSVRNRETHNTIFNFKKLLQVGTATELLEKSEPWERGEMQAGVNEVPRKETKGTSAGMKTTLQVMMGSEWGH